MVKNSFRANMQDFTQEAQKNGDTHVLSGRDGIFKALMIMFFFFWLIAIAFTCFYFDRIDLAVLSWLFGISILTINVFYIRSFIVIIIYMCFLNVVSPLFVVSGFILLCALGLGNFVNALLCSVILAGMLFYAYWDYRLIDKERLYCRFKRTCVTKISENNFLVTAGDFSKEREQLDVPFKSVKERLTPIVLVILPLLAGTKVMYFTPNYMETVGLVYFLLPVAYLQIMLAPLGMRVILPFILNLQFYFRARRELRGE